MVNTLAKSGGGSSALGQYIVVAFLAAVVVFTNLGGQTLDDHECRMALTARAMTEDDSQWLIPGKDIYEIPPRTTLNNIMVPVENGQPRLAKTPLAYWCAAGWAMLHKEMGLPGPAVNEWTARMSSALATVLVALLTLAIGRKLLPPRAAFMGAVMLAVSFAMQKWGRSARPEMLLCLFTTAAMGAFWMGLEAATRRGRAIWMIAFWVLMGLGNLSKEFVPLLLSWPLIAFVLWRASADRGDDSSSLSLLRRFLILTGIGAGVYLFTENVPALQLALIGHGSYLLLAGLGLPMLYLLVRSRGWRRIIPLLPTAIPGIVIMAALFVPWYMYMFQVFPDMMPSVFNHEVINRATGDEDWAVQAPYYYFGAVVVFTLPWLAFLPGAFVAPLMRRFSQHRKGVVYLLLWAIGVFMLFTLSAGKREHYILPMIPAVCLLIGYIAEDVLFNHRWITAAHARIIGVLYATAAIGGTLLVIVMAMVSSDPAWPSMVAPSVAAAVPMTIAGWLAWRGRLRSFVGLVAVSMALMHAGHWMLISSWDKREHAEDFAVAARDIVKADQVFHFGDPQFKVPFYLGRHVPAIQWPFQRLAKQEAEQAIKAGQDPAIAQKKAADQGEQQCREWLQQDATHAPWLFSYSSNTEYLATMGYGPVLSSTEKDKAGFFVLFHRDPKWRASQPATQTTTQKTESP